MGGDHDCVDARLELGQCILHGGYRIGLDDQPVGGDPLVAEERECPVEPPAGGCAARVLVDDIAALGLVHGRDHRDLQVLVAPVLLHRCDELAAGDGLVGDDQQMHRLPPLAAATANSPRNVGRCSAVTRARSAHQWLFTSVSVAARSPFKTAWRAPGTPYSYGFPTTCGISSKLKIGGGDETCHSSVSARHGFDSAGAPRRMLVTML